MAISRDNAEIVAKEIQISLNLFERAEYVLNAKVWTKTDHFGIKKDVTKRLGIKKDVYKRNDIKKDVTKRLGIKKDVTKRRSGL